MIFAPSYLSFTTPPRGSLMTFTADFHPDLTTSLHSLYPDLKHNTRRFYFKTMYKYSVSRLNIICIDISRY